MVLWAVANSNSILRLEVSHSNSTGRAFLVGIGGPCPNISYFLVAESGHGPRSVQLWNRTTRSNKENNITANAMLPGIIDTSANRNAMPNEDYSMWQTPKQIAQMIERTIDEKCDGMLVRITD